jgi:hypothetical protein
LPADDGEPYADELIVVFPEDARRKAIFDVIEQQGRPDTVDDKPEIIDQGRVPSGCGGTDNASCDAWNEQAGFSIR